MGVEWIRKAAEHPNDANGKASLGEMYRDGRGVSRDITKAHMWASLALLNGESRAAALRDEVVTKMTPQQITEAQQLAKQCQAQGFKGC